jgi:6-phosphogluconolactonase (cycloisomerase 2 family)
MKHKYLRYLALMVTVFAGLATTIGSGGGGGDGGGVAPPSSVVLKFPRYAFVVSREDDSVSTYVVDSVSGRLKFISRAGTGTRPVSIAVDLAGEFAYVANNFTNGNDGTISKYAIGADGGLTEIGVPTAISPSIGLASVAVDPNSKYVYAANSQSNDVLVYAIQPNGDLTLVPCVGGGGVVCGITNGDGFATGSQPRFVTVDPSGKYAYVANFLDDDVSQYNVAADGTLAQMTTPTVGVGAGPWSITIDSGGKHAYIALSGTTTVAAFNIGTDGSLSFLDSDISGASPRSVAVDPLNRYAYAANSGSDDVAQFTVSADGSLTAMSPVPSVTAGDEPFSIIADPSGRFTYVANFGTGDDTVSQFTIGVGGRLSPNAPAVIAAPPGPRYLSMTSGLLPVRAVPKYAYAANSGANTVSQYSIGTDGTLSPNPDLAGRDVSAGTSPVSVTVDPSGRYAYVANSGEDSVSAYSIDSGTGVLTQIVCAVSCVGDNFSAGTVPVSVTVDPSGRYAYVANSGASNSVSQYTIGSDGSLGLIGTVSPGVATAPVSVTVDTSGRYAYVANSGEDSVSAYSIDSGTGALTQIVCAVSCVGNNFAAETVPVSVTVDPSGRYAYVANSGANNSVSQFTIGSDGTLSAMTPSSVLSGGFDPVSVTVDPNGKYAYVANSSSNTVSQYSIGNDGTLTALATPTVVTGFGPASVTVDPSGKYAYVANSGASDSVSQFAIGSDGTLSPLTPASELAGTDPVSVTTIGTWN